MPLIGYLYLCLIVFLSTDAAAVSDFINSPKRQLQCDLIIRQSGYEVEDIAMGFGGDSVYLTCDARCKGPGATPALAWFKEPSMTAIPSTRGRVSSYGRSSNRVQRLIIHFFLQRDVGRYTCKGWLGLFLGWVEKSIWLQMGCTHPRIACDIYQCLPEKYRCDGVRHCEDGFDEYECGSDSCNKTEFYCDGRCHDIKIRCNSEVDCHDYLDEMDCHEEQKTTWEPGINDDYDIEDYNATETTNTTISGCETDLYQCSDELFIPLEWMCDGMEDCSQGDDEWDCWNSTSDQPTTTPDMEVDCPIEVKSSGHYYDIFNDTCYLFVNETAYWIEAEQYCRDMDGDLVQIYSMETMDYIIVRLCSDELGWNSDGVWNGANTLQGDWDWPSDGEPSYSVGRFATEVCAVMKRSEGWQWQDWHCGRLDRKFQYICQFEIAIEDHNRTTSVPPSPTTPESCNPLTQFECWRGSSETFRACIPLPWMCDGRPDCLNEEDEEACTTTTTTFGPVTSTSSSVQTTIESVCPRQFNCGDGSCVSLTQRCDNVPDCADERDELNCPSISCLESNVACEDGKQCISISKWRDGVCDCKDGSDEIKC